MSTLIRQLVLKFAQQVSGEVKLALAPIAPYLRMLGVGVVLLLVSVPLWVSGFFLMLASVFMRLAHQEMYLAAALGTGAVSWALALLCVVSAFRFLRRPR